MQTPTSSFQRPWGPLPWSECDIKTWWNISRVPTNLHGTRKSWEFGTPRFLGKCHVFLYCLGSKHLGATSADSWHRSKAEVNTETLPIPRPYCSQGAENFHEFQAQKCCEAELQNWCKTWQFSQTWNQSHLCTLREGYGLIPKETTTSWY